MIDRLKKITKDEFEKEVYDYVERTILLIVNGGDADIHIPSDFFETDSKFREGKLPSDGKDFDRITIWSSIVANEIKTWLNREYHIGGAYKGNEEEENRRLVAELWRRIKADCGVERLKEIISRVNEYDRLNILENIQKVEMKREENILNYSNYINGLSDGGVKAVILEDLIQHVKNGEPLSLWEEDVGPKARSNSQALNDDETNSMSDGLSMEEFRDFVYNYVDRTASMFINGYAIDICEEMAQKIFGVDICEAIIAAQVSRYGGDKEMREIYDSVKDLGNDTINQAINNMLWLKESPFFVPGETRREYTKRDIDALKNIIFNPDKSNNTEAIFNITNDAYRIGYIINKWDKDLDGKLQIKWPRKIASSNLTDGMRERYSMMLMDCINDLEERIAKVGTDGKEREKLVKYIVDAENERKEAAGSIEEYDKRSTNGNYEKAMKGILNGEVDDLWKLEESAFSKTALGICIHFIQEQWKTDKCRKLALLALYQCEDIFTKGVEFIGNAFKKLRNIAVGKLNERKSRTSAEDEITQNENVKTRFNIKRDNRRKIEPRRTTKKH